MASVKIDPVMKKTLSRNELGIIVLFAAANGDILTLKRFEWVVHYCLNIFGVLHNTEVTFLLLTKWPQV